MFNETSSQHRKFARRDKYLGAGHRFVKPLIGMLAVGLGASLINGIKAAAATERHPSLSTMALEMQQRGWAPHQAKVDLFVGTPNDPIAEMKMRSASTNTKNVRFLEVEIYDVSYSTAKNAPTNDISYIFRETKTGDWTASKKTTSLEGEHQTTTVKEIGQTVVERSTYDEINGRKVYSYWHENHSGLAANEVFYHLVANAY